MTAQGESTTTQSESMTEQQQDTFLDDAAEFLSEQFEAAFAILIERRDDAYAKAVATLDDERMTLARESVEIEEAAGNLESLLAAKEREANRQADSLLLDGKQEEAQAKLTEAEAARNAPGAMRDRQREIEARYRAIEDEKEVAAHRVAEAWLAECQKITRAAEHGYFITLLDGLKQSLSEFKQRTGTVAYDSRFQNISIRDLTADAGSEERNSGCGWYKVW
jgi:HD-GYP domain-containing protein (c-di-GMP phosphodiesterase class II)